MYTYLFFLGLILINLFLGRIVRIPLINRLLGYGRALPGKNKEARALANSFSVKCLTIISIAAVIFHLVATIWVQGFRLLLLSLLFFALGLLLVMILTEVFVRSIFDKDGNIRVP